MYYVFCKQCRPWSEGVCIDLYFHTPANKVLGEYILQVLVCLSVGPVVCRQSMAKSGNMKYFYISLWIEMKFCISIKSQV